MEKSLKKGFTLIELLVVIAIIGILSSVVLVSLNNARTKARDAARKTNIQQITTALSLYSDAFDQAVPVDVDCTVVPVWAGWVTTGASDIGCPKALVTDGYLPRLIEDTITGTYGYKNAGDNNTFCAVAILETTNADPFLCDGTGCRESVGATIVACTEA